MPREFERASLMGPAALHAFYRPGMNSPDAIPLEVVRCPPPPNLRVRARTRGRYWLI